MKTQIDYAVRGGHGGGVLMSKRWAAAAAVALVGVTLGVPALLPVPAQAREAIQASAPFPRDVFREDFEQGTTVVDLDKYVGATGQQYTAAPGWLDHCNGQVRSWQNDPSDYGNCNSDPFSAARLDQLAYALGYATDPTTATTNRALTAYTGASLTPGQVELQTVGVAKLSGKGRFLGLSLESAAMNCGDQGPIYGFSFVDQNNVATPVGSGFNPCNVGTDIKVPAKGSSGEMYIKVASFYSSESILFSATSPDSGVGLQITNSAPDGNGNDAAIDNIKIVDMTPMLTPSFARSVARVGESVRLTYTVTNTSDGASKNNWSFQVPLPTGVVVASTPNSGSSCGSSTVVTAAAGTSQVQASGNLTGASCTVSVDVTAASAGSYVTDFTQSTGTLMGLDQSGSSSVKFIDVPSLSLVKTASASDSNGDGVIGVDDSIAYSFLVKNTGTSDVTSVTVTDPLLPGAVSCPPTPASSPLTAGNSITCTSTSPYKVKATDVSNRTVHNTATVTATDTANESVTAQATADVTVGAPDPKVTLSKSAQVASGPSKVGDVVTFSYRVVNTGNVPLTGVVVTERSLTRFSGHLE